MSDEQFHWPQTMWLVRHGQSAGNVARDAAEASGHTMIDIANRDMDVPLSALGEQQARALGRWLATLPADCRPDGFFFSPYVRARETAALMAETAGIDRSAIDWVCDERLREKEFGILDRLTVHGIRRIHPQLAEQRLHIGKFYFRPPGGESWCDVILRLRSFVDTLRRVHHGQRVVIVAHQVVVNCMRYLLESLDEAALLAIDRKGDVPNCSVTSYELDADGPPRRCPRLDLEHFVAPLEATGTPVTVEPDVPAAPKP
jgi:broad specificity phosphatase PhoE